LTHVEHPHFQPENAPAAGSARPLSLVRRLWLALTGQQSPAPASTPPPAVLHDPAAQQPHDLDDPFFDGKVQTRMGDVIAQAGQKK
jgi:hypothetical protein